MRARTVSIPPVINEGRNPLKLSGLVLLFCLLGATLSAQEVPIGAEGARVLSVEFSVKEEGKTYERVPDSAPRHVLIKDMRTRVARLFKSSDLKKDIRWLRDRSHLFREVDWRVTLNEKVGGVRVKLIVKQPLIHEMRIVGPLRGRWSEAGVKRVYRFMNQIDSAEGSVFSITRLDADVKRLFDTGGFLDVRTEYRYTKKGVDLLFRVIQSQPVDRVAFSGIYRNLTIDKLRGVLSGTTPVQELPVESTDELVGPVYIPKDAFDGYVTLDAGPGILEGARRQIEAWYRYEGYRFVSVTPRLISLGVKFDREQLLRDNGSLSMSTLDTLEDLHSDGAGGRLVLVFEVHEGPRVLVGEIEFENMEGMEGPDDNDALDASRISGVFSPIWQIWYAMPWTTRKDERDHVMAEVMKLAEGENFVREYLDRDVEAAQAYLRARGWRDARVSLSTIEFNRARTRANIKIGVYPGDMYAVTDVRIELQTTYPRVPEGAERPEYDKPVIEFPKILRALDADGSGISTQQARTLYGDEYVDTLDQPQNGKFLGTYVLENPIPWDEFRFQGEVGRPSGDTATILRALFAEEGYSNITVEFVPVETQKQTAATDWDLPTSARRVGMILRISQGYKSYVGDVTIRGNDVTRENVIRREMDLYTGDVFNRNRMTRSVNRLKRKQWFEQAAAGQGVLARPTPRLVELDDEIREYTDIDIEVVEGRSNSFNFSAGFNTTTGFAISVDLSLRNFDISSFVSWMYGEPNWSFSGAGQIVTLTAQPPLDRQQRYSLGFVEPWLFGYPVEGGISGEYSTLDRGLYTDKRTGIDPYVGWRFAPDWLWSVGYSFEIRELDDVASNAAQEIKRDQGRDTLSSLWTRIIWRTTDSNIFPTRGWEMSARYQYTGGFLGGTVDFWRLQTSASFYFPVARLDRSRTLVFAISTSAYWQDVHSDTDRIPFIHRFLMGSNPVSGRGMLRGYEFAGVGPSRNDEAIGGNFMVHGFTEIRLPVFPGTFWIVGFVDAGILSTTINTFDPNGFTVSGGFGLRLVLPILPVPFAMDFGFPIYNQPGNREEVININLGFSF